MRACFRRYVSVCNREPCFALQDTGGETTDMNATKISQKCGVRQTIHSTFNKNQYVRALENVSNVGSSVIFQECVGRSIKLVSSFGQDGD